MAEVKKYGQTYDLPEIKEEFVDVEKGEVVDKKDIPPIEIIKALAKKFNFKISDPNKGCKHCYGRGYDGIDSKTRAPFPCSCLFRDRTEKQKYMDAIASQAQGKYNHDTRRKMKANIKKRTLPIRRAMVGISNDTDSIKIERPMVDIFKPKNAIIDDACVSIPTESSTTMEQP